MLGVGGHPQAEGQRPFPALGFAFQTQWLLYLKKKKERKKENHNVWNWKESNPTLNAPLLEIKKRKTIH